MPADEPADEPAEEPATPAEVLVRHPTAVLSHESAARELGLSLASDDGCRRITVPRNTSRLHLPGWLVVRRDLAETDLLELPDGRRVTPVLTTVVDLASDLSLSAAVALGDDALRGRRVTLPELLGALEGRAGANTNRRRDVARLLDPRCGSVLESLLRVLLLTSCLPVPLSQYPILAGERLLARVDFCWPAQRLIVEADGFAFHSDRAAYRADRERMNALESLGWRVLRFTWEDVVGRPAYVLALVGQCLEPLAA